MARGKSRSATIEEVVSQAEALGEKGIKEIVLTGVNTGDFGKNVPLVSGYSLQPSSELPKAALKPKDGRGGRMEGPYIF